MKKWSIRSSGRGLLLGLVALTVMALGQGQARADEVTISGSTTGIVTGVPQLTFTGNNFTGMTFGGVGALSDDNRLGTFTLATGNVPAVNGSFTLNVTFTQPSGIVGGQGTTFTAQITGSVSPNVNQGGVNVNFNNNNPVVFNFTNGTTTGSFSLAIPDIFVQSGQVANLTAGIAGSQTAIPEPTTMLLLGTGLAGVAAKARRRRKA